MKINKVSNADLFTSTANENYRKHVKTKSKRALEILKEIVNWPALINPIEQRIDEGRSLSKRGRPRFTMTTIVRCFILQYIYGLSDPRLEEEIADRRSFQMFLDINTGDSIPDETTICKYREKFSRLGLDELLFENFKKQLERKGMILERTTLVDATIKEAQAKYKSGRDKDARYTKKGGKGYYGYKGHIGLDLGSGIIHSLEFTSANKHDSTQFEKLIHGRERSIFGDKAYFKLARERMLKRMRITSCIQTKGSRNNPLSRNQESKNRQLSRIRNAVEQPFAYMKRILNYIRCSYYDETRNRFEFVMSSLIYNMNRYIQLSGA